MSDLPGASAFPHGQRRVVIEGVTPQVDGGRFNVKRIVGDRVTIEADVFADGHDEIAVRLLWRLGSDEWQAQEMEPLGNDRWRAALALTQIGRYAYVIEGRVDHLLTWIRDLGRRIEAGTVTAVDLQIGSALVADLASRASEPSDATRLRAAADQLADAATRDPKRAVIGRDPSVATLARRYPDPGTAVLSPPLTVVVDRERARFSSWYEAFPRSMSLDEGRHGTFRDVIAALPTVAAMGFDVLYLPPIHPIGRSFRKGPNNSLEAGAGDPGVPWAIGSTDGGHDAIHPELGSMEDFRDLVAAARVNGLEIALDIAFQASPDHPWVKQHPTWFKHRPDGSIQYAENPPKRYQDIYPFDFESGDWQGLWQALLDVMRFWAAEGVRVLRVDNPHTKAFPFWEWAIAALTAEYPDVILLAEAFTRPKVMYRLAKVGFSQSYTYFTWKTTKAELTDYFTELMTTDVRETFRPNVWPNTPDILHETLQVGGRPAFEARLVLAATLSSNYGIYGPVFELMEANPREPGSEEYMHSEKYQLRRWDVSDAETLRPLITLVNGIRREHRALQANDGLRFHHIDDDALIAYSKRSADGSDAILTIVNLDPRVAHAETLRLDRSALGLADSGAIVARDLLDGAEYQWTDASPWVELIPGKRQAHIFTVRAADEARP